jgi:hypothetical protein
MVDGETPTALDESLEAQIRATELPAIVVLATKLYAAMRAEVSAPVRFGCGPLRWPRKSRAGRRAACGVRDRRSPRGVGLDHCSRLALLPCSPLC